MFWNRVIISLSEFIVCLLLSVFIVYWSYKSFCRFNTAFDAEKEIYKGNAAVAILMSSLMYAAAIIMRESVYPVISIVTVGLTESGEGARSFLTLFAYALGHLVLGFLLAVGCVQIALRAFDKLNKQFDEDKEVGKGNVAVAVIMGAVVVIIALFMQQGVSALSKSLIPQPTLGSLRMMD